MSSPSVPVAVVGAGVVLPDALDAPTLWSNVLAGRSAIDRAPADRWRLSPARGLASPDAWDADRSWTDLGGYVRGFERVFDPTGLRLDAAFLASLDPLSQWLVHCGREALRGCGLGPDADHRRTGAVIGNLSFPSSGMSLHAESVWLERSRDVFEGRAAERVHPRAANPWDRFMSGLPAQTLARALGLGAGAYALDAACASGLYAIRLACDRLADGSADLMLAGAVNRADDLFIHVGFCSLGAISKSGHSRPFDRSADGLIPAEGAALVALKRLDDALRDGDEILGVVRGVGLSNDGRGRSLLAPAQEGQARAMRAAYRQAGFSPEEISLVECHATGTPVGDATELASLSEVFGDGPPVPVGSLKSNLGHLITSAGVAGLLKVLGALRHRTRPPTLGVSDPIPTLAQGRFRPLLEAEPWTPPRSGAPLRASVSAFGFGGNNAHLLVEEAPGAGAGHTPAFRPTPALDPIAIVGLGVAAAAASDPRTFAEHWRDDRTALRASADGLDGRLDPIEVGVEGLRFPPRDLERALPQQVLALRVVLEAMQSIDTFDRERCLLAVGMGADTNVARYGARWRVADWFDQLRPHAEAVDETSWVESAREALIGKLDSAGVVGTMPNIPANRLNRQLDAAQSGFTVSAEEASGLVALDIAVRSLRLRETDLALAAAVDLCCNEAHQHAVRACLGDAHPVAGDAGAAFALMRLDDALAQGRTVWAVLDDVRTGTPLDPTPALDDVRVPLDRVERLFGHAHAAQSAVAVAAAIVDLATGRATRREVAVTSLLGGTAWAKLSAPPTPPPALATLRGGGIAEGARTLRFDAHAPEPTLPPLARANPAADVPTPPAPNAPRPESAPMRSNAPLPAAPALPPTTSTAPAVPPAAFRLAWDLGESTPAVPQVEAPPSALPAAYAPVEARPASTHALTTAAAPPPSSSGFLYGIAHAHQQHVAAMNAGHLAWMEMHQRMTSMLLHGITLGADARPASPAVEPAAPWIPAPAPEPRQEPAAQPPAALPPAPVHAPSLRTPPAASAPPPRPPAAASAKAGPSAAGVAHTWEPSRPVWEATALPGLKCDRDALEILASDRISRVFGSQFEGQDGYHVQVRMPEPPMLLADRVIGLDAEARSMTTGTIWTETDVRSDAWWLTHGHMPPGIMIESGQADLLLISWLGIDFHNRGERQYRLLGCELMYHGGLPTVGDTLQYDIHADGHAKHGDVRIFFFHYDCRVRGDIRLSVRQGQAGFFTEEELAASAGVLWDAETGERVENPRLDPGPNPTTKSAFDAADLVAFSEGDLWTCFGDGFHRTASHTRSPRGGSGRLHMLDRVEELSFTGGPWGRGYLRAVDEITPEDWFFEGHFKNDPCMPGTLMFEGCLEAMAFYLAAMGFTIDRDGWRFEPVPETAYKLLCRGQVVPSSKRLVYEIFVEEVWDGERPTLWADMLCTVDGLKAFHCRRMGVQLTPDWPKDEERRRMAEAGTLPDLTPDRVASIGDLKLDYDSILACAYGRPSEAFGEKYAIFDGGRRCPRLPGPPYLFITRILNWEGELGGMQIGTVVETEYDFGPDAWYFEANGQRAMPWCVLLEAALQPCGWLASFTGGALTAKGDVCFRNLDGHATLTREILPADSTFRTRVVTTNVARSGSTTVFSFDVEGWLDGEKILDLSTVFGFFPPAALVHQVGLGSDASHKHLRYRDDGEILDLTSLPDRWFGGSARIAPDKLRMIDRITGLWPTEGEAGEGIIRCEKTIDARDWYFQAHFYQDAVMPGSLGIEAMLEALQCLALARDLDRELENPVFEVLPTNLQTTWKYRGQVIPERERVVVVLEATRVEREEHQITLHARGSLWVDDLRIYEAPALAVRLRAGGPRAPRPPGGGTRDGNADRSEDEPAGAEPTASEPAASEPAASEPAASEPTASEPTASEPTASEPAGAGPALAEPAASEPAGAGPALADVARLEGTRIHVETHPWLLDHCPTFVVPVVPMTGLLDLFAGGALRRRPGAAVRGFEDVIATRWFDVPPQGAEFRLRVDHEESESMDLTLLGVRETVGNARAPFTYARARVLLGSREAWPEPPHEGLRREDATDARTQYEDGHLFHGPSLRGLVALARDGREATGWIDAAKVTTPPGICHPGLLDVLTHPIPHDALHLWSDRIATDRIAYPFRIPRLTLHGPMPTEGELRVTARFRGFDGDDRFPVTEIEASAEGRVLVRFRLVEVLVPAGPIGQAPAASRRAFLAERAYRADVGLARIEGDTASVDTADVRASDWLPGTLSSVYRTGQGPVSPRASQIGAQEWVAHALARAGQATHPGEVVATSDGTLAWPHSQPLRRWRFAVEEDERATRVRYLHDHLDLTPIRSYWRERMRLGHWAVEDLYYGLVERFVETVELEDPDDFARLRGRPVLFLADHQTGIESLLFSIVASGLTETPVLTLAKAQHRTSWLGRLIAHCFDYPGVDDPGVITFFERDDAASLLRIVETLRNDITEHGKSVHVHVEGTRATTSRHAVETVGSAFLDLARATGTPIVPVRYRGGLPATPVDTKLEFPLGYARQTIHLGRAIPAETLARLPLRQQKELVRDGIRRLGPPHAETPEPVGQPAFEARVEARVARTGAEVESAVLMEVLQDVTSPCDEIEHLRAAERAGQLSVGTNPNERWLGELGKLLFGPRGARVVDDSPP